jgi:hypothetical protein
MYETKKAYTLAVSLLSCTHRASAHNFLHALHPVDIQPTLCILNSESGLPQIQVVEVIGLLNCVKCCTNCWVHNTTRLLVSIFTEGTLQCALPFWILLPLLRVSTDPYSARYRPSLVSSNKKLKRLFVSK